MSNGIPASPDTFVTCGHPNCRATGLIEHDDGTTAFVAWATPPGTEQNHRHYVKRRDQS